MRKLIVLLGVLAVLTVGLVPVMAQDQTIVEIAAGNPDFSTLVAAVQAAGLVETLSGEGPFTVFAPTNAAFEKLGADTIAAALADNALLTAVLTYHVVPGKLTIGQVSASETLTTVQGSDIVVTKRDGQLFLNDNVAFVATNIQASNGIIHVIDTVLLPPTEGAAAEPAPAAEPAGDTVKIRVAHFSPDAPAVDVYINGVKSDIQGLAFPEITPWVEVPAGTYNIAVAPAGTSVASAILPPADFELPAGAWITVAAVGKFQRGRGTFNAQVIVEDHSPIPAGSARVTVFHAIEGAPTVDVKAGGAPIISVLGYPGKLGSNDGVATLDVPAGTYDLSVTPTSSDYPIILNLPGTTLEANNFYFVAAIGTPTEPSVALAVTPGS